MFWKKKKNFRAHQRHNILHLKFATLIVESNRYPIIDFSKGGISIYSSQAIDYLEENPVIRDAHIEIGDSSHTINFEAVSFDKDQKFIGIKIVKASKKTLRFLDVLSKGMELGSKDNNPKISNEKKFLKIQTKKFIVEVNTKKFRVVKKPLFFKKIDIPVLCLGYLMGLSRKLYDVRPILKLIPIS